MAEKKAYQAHQGYNATVHDGDGRAIRLEDGADPYVTSNVDDQYALDGAAFVKTVPVPEKKPAKTDEGGKA